MRLSDYLAASGTNGAEFARQVGSSRAAVTRWLSGARVPSGAMMRAIVTATGGQVQPNDFYAAPAAEETAA